MKAPSDIFTTIQKPFTILGVPFKLFVIVSTTGILLFLLLGSAVSKGLAFLVGLLVLFVGNYIVAQKAKEDHHMEQRLLVALPFFKGKDSRHLIPGIPNRKKSKKERAF
ncbi:MAG: VirB3 family type IV secretion system protein [Methylocystaceae bacterium]|nr:VirB3 family type IV secretion system protein [Methylocystaceae bacterium]